MLSLTLLALSLTPVLSNPVPSQSIVLNYDDAPSNPVLAQTPLGVYKGLEFGTFSAREDGVGVLRSVSPKNTAKSNSLNNQLKGSVPNITSKYDGSNVAYFDLYSTYVGCGVTTEASAGLPQSCKIQFKAIKKDGTTTQQYCEYGGTVLKPALVFCDFKNALNGITYVAVTVVKSLTTPMTTVEFLDNTYVKEYFYKS